jgi:hypothetical protein
LIALFGGRNWMRRRGCTGPSKTELKTHCAIHDFDESYTVRHVNSPVLATFSWLVSPPGAITFLSFQKHPCLHVPPKNRSSNVGMFGGNIHGTAKPSNAAQRASSRRKLSSLKDSATYNFDSKLIFALQSIRCKPAQRKMVKIAIAGGSGSRLSRREMPYV